MTGIPTNNSAIDSPFWSFAYLETKYEGFADYIWKKKRADETKKVEHIVLDFTKTDLQNKVDQIRKKEKLSKTETVTTDSAMVAILKDYGRDVEQFKPVRQIIDFRSIQTKKVSVLNMTAMISLIVVPFLL